MFLRHLFYVRCADVRMSEMKNVVRIIYLISFISVDVQTA